MFRPLVLVSLLVVSAYATPLVAAQAPKAGAYYEDKTDLGFKIQVPKDWDFVPPQPNDPNMIGKYVAPHNGGMQLKSGRYWAYEVHLVKFDRREKGEDDRTRPRFRGAETATEYIEQNFNAGVDWKPDGDKKIKIGKLDAKELQFMGSINDEDPARLYVAVIPLSPDVDIALVGNGPGEKKWSKFESPFQQMARSFKTLDTASAATGPVGDSMREIKRAKLKDELTRLPGWQLYESANYFIVTDSKDEPFVKEMMERLEAIRKIYEETYTAKQALELRRKAIALQNARTDGGGVAPPKPKSEDEEEAPPMTEEDLLSSFEASRACVVRLCGLESMYHSYGGPNGSAGYWNPSAEELVVYDDKQEGGRKNTWKTLNHEAFHQYIFYFYGSISPHSWYNEGSGDFYAGYQYGKDKKFVLKPFDWRVEPVREMVRESNDLPAYVPLKKFTRYTQGEYYGPNIGKNYAQGWAFIYFLRTANGKYRGWNPAWNSILPTYLETLAITGNLDQAVDKAFEGVDWDALEKAWTEYMRQVL